jgi:hypothetical protein
MSRAEFVANLALPEPHEYANLTAVPGFERAEFPRTRSATGDATSAEIICGCLCCFCDGLTAENKMDVTNSILLAQLAANKKFDRFQKPLDWYRSYSEVLSNIGWNVPGFTFDKYPPKGGTVNTVDLDQAVLSIARSEATTDELAVLAAAVNAAKSQATGDPSLSIWNANSSNGGDANFQIVLVASRGGSITALIIGCAFRATPSQIRFLSWRANPEIQRSVSRLELNSDHYSGIRQEIVNKLKGKAEIFVAALAL